MKKIIAIVAVIATIIACLCIGASAYESGDIIEAGTIITFKETYTAQSSGSYADINFISNGNEYTRIFFRNTIAYNETEVYNNEAWINNGYRTIELTSDYTVGSNINLIRTLNENVQSAVKPPLKRTIDNTKATFATTLTFATAIIAWLVTNQIALVGLYLYIFIVLIATGKRYIKGV